MSTGSFLSERWQSRVRIVTYACGAAVSGCLMVASFDLVAVEREAGDIIGWRIPTWIAVSIMPLGYGMIAGRVIWRSSEDWKGRFAAAGGLLIPLLVFVYKDTTPTGLLLPGSLAILAVTAVGREIALDETANAGNAPVISTPGARVEIE